MIFMLLVNCIYSLASAAEWPHAHNLTPTFIKSFAVWKIRAFQRAYATTVVYHYHLLIHAQKSLPAFVLMSDFHMLIDFVEMFSYSDRYALFSRYRKQWNYQPICS